jgi:hypothetical protein
VCTGQGEDSTLHKRPHAENTLRDPKDDLFVKHLVYSPRPLGNTPFRFVALLQGDKVHQLNCFS